MRDWRRQLFSGAVLGIALSLGTAGTAAAQPAPAPDPGPNVSINVFFNALSPYGAWQQNPHWGWVWYPNTVPAGWRPYTHGHWMLTDDGWTWVSDWQWGWGPFHYGRWFDDPDFGWTWVPGAVWGPAWVVWEQSPDYIGWAPLPPQVGWSWSAGLEVGDLQLGSMLPPAAFCFVRDSDFLDRDLRQFIVPRYRSDVILPRAHVITRYGIEDGRIINHGVPPEYLERRYGRHIPRYGIEGVESPRAERREGRYEHGRVEFYRPHFREGERFEPPQGEEGILGPLLQPFEELQRRQEEQRRGLERRHEEERRQLEHEQNQERRHPPEGMRPEELQRRQEHEREFMQNQHERENHQMEQRHSQERQRYEEQQRQRGGEHERGGEHHGGEGHGGEQHGGEGHGGEQHGGGDHHGGH